MRKIKDQLFSFLFTDACLRCQTENKQEECVGKYYTARLQYKIRFLTICMLEFILILISQVELNRGVARLNLEWATEEHILIHLHCLLFTVVWNDYLLIFWPNVIFYYTRSWKPNANNQICWITKVSTRSKTLIQFCWKFIYFKDVYWWFLKIWICDKMRALFIFQIIDYAWIEQALFPRTSASSAKRCTEAGRAAPYQADSDGSGHDMAWLDLSARY